MLANRKQKAIYMFNRTYTSDTPYPSSLLWGEHEVLVNSIEMCYRLTVSAKGCFSFAKQSTQFA